VRSRELWILAGLIVVGLLVRATRLTESLWYDEIAAWRVFGVLGPGAIVSSYSEPSNHILHTLLSWCAVTWLQGGLGFELALRLPALLFSLGGVVAVFGLVRLVSGPRAGLIAAGLMAVLPVAVLEGVEARGYSMMICFAALADWAFLANLKAERAWRWVVYAGLCAAGTWTHPVTAFVPVGHALWLAGHAVRHRRVGLVVRGGLAIAGSAAISIALYAPVIGQIVARRGMYASARGDEPLVFGPEGWHALLQLGGSWYWWAAWPGLALAVLGFARLRKDPAVPVTLLGLPVFVAVVLAAGSWMYARFALFSLPGAVLLAATGLEALARWRRPAKQPLRDAADCVRAGRVDDEPGLVVGLAHRVMDLYLDDPAYSLFHGADLERKLGEIDPVWVVLYYPRSVSPQAYALLEDHGFVVDRRFPGWVDWNNGDVIVYRRGHSRGGESRK
jgi:hypothetical protein